MARFFFGVISLIFLISGIAYAESDTSKDNCADIGRFQLFQGAYKTYDLKSQQGITSTGIFIIDTKTGSVKRYLNKIDENGKYIEIWVPTEVQPEKN